MLENSFYTNNNVDKQVFNACGPITYLSQGTTSYVYLGVDVAGVPAANGDFYQRTTTTVAYFKTDSTGATAPTPLVNDRFTYGDGTTNGWINATITVVTDSTTYWLLTLGTAFAGALTTSSTYTLDDLRPNYQWQTWSKPEGRTTAYIVCIGGGGGGGGGMGYSSSLARVGGGGGASSAITIAQVPFYSIPDTLYIQVGVGGTGGAGGVYNATIGGASGTSGGISYVSCYPSINMSNMLLVNSLTASGGGGGGVTLGTGGTGGIAAAALTTSATTNPRYLSLCNWTSYAGQAGAGGSNGNSAAGNQTITSNTILSGGAGGGGVSGTNTIQTSGSQNSGDTLTSFLKTLSGGVTGSVAGVNGYSYLKPFLSVGGSGGGSILNGQAGAGGNATFGSGGGGGGTGGGTIGNATFGGNGGNGGNGLVMIISY